MNDHTTCAGSCGSCGGSCGGCCGGALELTQPEIDLLRRFAQLPFLPVARRADQETPVCLEDVGAPEALSAAIQNLALKGLIRLDYDLPLSNFDYAAYAPYHHKGSMALTARGQAAVEVLEIQGIGE